MYILSILIQNFPKFFIILFSIYNNDEVDSPLRGLFSRVVNLKVSAAHLLYSANAHRLIIPLSKTIVLFIYINSQNLSFWAFRQAQEPPVEELSITTRHAEMKSASHPLIIPSRGLQGCFFRKKQFPLNYLLALF